MIKTKILLTGTTGFICSNLAIYLVNKYTDTLFIGIDKNTYCSNIKNINEIQEKHNFIFIESDIVDEKQMKDLFSKYKFDWVIHLAAYSHVDNSFGNSLDFTMNNIYGTHVLLELSKQYNVTKFIHMSTDEVYGSRNLSSNEYTMLDPTNPYSATKSAAEQIVRSYFHSFKLPIVILRSNNIYGPKQYPEKVIPKFIMRILNELPCEIQGSGKQKRSFLYIDDFCNAMDVVLNNAVVGETYNIGSEDEISIIKLHELVSREMKSDNEVDYVKDREFNDIRYNISFQKAIDLGWKPETEFRVGLKKTIDWYCKNKDYWSKEQIIHLFL